MALCLADHSPDWTLPKPNKLTRCPRLPSAPPSTNLLRQLYVFPVLKTIDRVHVGFIVVLKNIDHRESVRPGSLSLPLAMDAERVRSERPDVAGKGAGLHRHCS